MKVKNYTPDWLYKYDGYMITLLQTRKIKSTNKFNPIKKVKKIKPNKRKKYFTPIIQLCNKDYIEEILKGKNLTIRQLELKQLINNISYENIKIHNT